MHAPGGRRTEGNSRPYEQSNVVGSPPTRAAQEQLHRRPRADDSHHIGEEDEAALIMSPELDVLDWLGHDGAVAG